MINELFALLVIVLCVIVLFLLFAWLHVGERNQEAGEVNGNENTIINGDVKKTDN